MTTMVNETLAPPPVPTRRPLLERRIDLGGINLEWVAYGLLFLASVVMHFWQLGHMAMAHDESIHAWMSWKFFTGRGDFNCAGGRKSPTYCYDPVYHGPTLYFATLISYFLFGISDATARLPQTLAGLALIPGCYLLRPIFGKRPALIAAVLVALSPSMVYFARYARHDELILLWTLLLAAGLWRWIQTGGTGSLVLAAAGAALAWATHELVFILLYIGVTFLAFRLFWEWRPRLFITLASFGLAAAAVVVAATVGTDGNERLNAIMQRLLGPAILLGVGALMSLLFTRSWPATPILTNRLRSAWSTRPNADPDRPPTLLGNVPPALLWAIVAFLLIFGLLFSTFLAYPRGFLDGWYQGIKYWWGSQHDYARGGQPWYYYLMLLPIYELLATVFVVSYLLSLISKGTARALVPVARRLRPATTVVETRPPVDDEDIAFQRALFEGVHGDGSNGYSVGQRASELEALFVSFLAYWSVLSFIAFSWAGEKMPWLLIHTALPVTLLAAWLLSGLIGAIPWRFAWRGKGWSVPLLVIAAVILAGVSLYYLAGAGETQAAFRDRLRALPALAMFGAALFGLLTISANIGGRTVLRLSALTLAAVLLLYGVHSLVQVVYLHPDTPVEPLIYTQTAPDVPVIVDQIERLAINQSRNERTKDDPTGGLSMKITMDKDLAWPFYWYLRDYRSVCTEDFKKRNCGLDAPVVLAGVGNMTDDLRDTLADEHVRLGEGVLNWWFPENAPKGAEYRAYKDFRNDRWGGAWSVFSWPFRPSSWPVLARFMIYREVPHKLEGREFEVYVRRDVAPIIGGAAGQTPTQNEPLVAEATLGAGELSGPRGIATDAAGNLYVADSANHRVVVFDPAGTVLRTIGSQGGNDGQLNEPSGVAVDTQGNLYVADTWNARIAKFGPDGKWIKAWGSGSSDFGDGRRATDTGGDTEGNTANPLGFYGPRNVLVAGERVYIADTGNKRVVVTDLEGAFVEQFGVAGSQPGQFNEPIGLGSDSRGRIYVGDTWNGRVQIFARNDDGKIETSPEQVVKISGWESNSYNDPYLAVGPNGRLLVSLAGRNAVGVYDAAGSLELRLRAEQSQITPPKGLAFAPDGAVYVAGGNGQVLRFRLP